jgi:ornithine--oxo-acid transaminase
MNRIHWSSDQHIEATEDIGAHNYSPLPVVISEGKGVWVKDVEGKSYLDMLSGYSALNFGHSNPRLLAIAHKQLDTLCLTSRAFYHDQMAPFCASLSEICGGGKVLPMTSGAEAVETAVKLARKWGYERKGVKSNKAEILCFSGNFHGRTTTIVGFSDSPKSRDGFGPFPPGFNILPYGDIDAVEKALNPNVVGVLIEPIQGEGGVIIPPDGFMKKLRTLCTEHNVLLLADEIQTGLCRTGKLFACDHDDIRPDVYIVGKSLGGGIVPISAIVANHELMSVFTPGTHGSTFGGNTLACAIAAEVVAMIREEKPHLKAAESGAYIVEKLRTFGSPHIKEVRGRGLLIGVDIPKESGTAKDFCYRLLEEGILTKDTREQTIRITPPLFIDRKEIDWAMERLARVFAG